MKHLRLLLLLVLCLSNVWAADPVPNIVLISCDGLGRDLLQELLAAKKLPAFAAVINEGSLQEIEVTSHKSSTMPGHVTMLTGYLSDKHRFFNNDVVRAIPGGWTIFERMEQQLGTNSIQTIMVAGKSRNLGGATTNDVYGITRQNLDYFESSDQPAAAVVDNALPVLLRLKSPRFFLFLHFPDPDKAGHAEGKDSTAHREGIIKCDAGLARVIAALKAEKLYDTTRIYITADHGFDDHSREHKMAPHIFLATNDKAVMRGGRLVDVPVTILTRMGVDITKVDPPLAGQPLTVAAPGKESGQPTE
jgi:predicted AlkP superfamily pyrophosphatase or phosphodiesterase